MIIAVVLAQDAPASLLMIMNDISTAGADVVVIDDMGSGINSDTGSWTSTVGDNSANAGMIEFSGNVGTFVVNVTTGISAPVAGGTTLSLTSVNISGGTPGMMEIWLIDTDFADNGYGFNTQFGGHTNGSVSFLSTADTANQEGGFAGNYVYGPGSFLEFEHPYASNGAFSFDDYASNIVAGDNSYSMALGVLVDHDQANDITAFAAKLSQVPEPGTFAVWSVFAMGMLYPTRRRKKA